MENKMPEMYMLMLKKGANGAMIGLDFRFGRFW